MQRGKWQWSLPNVLSIFQYSARAMLCSKKSTSTKVECISQNPISMNTPCSLVGIFKILSFSKWTGHWPFDVTRETSGSFSFKFVRFRAASLLWLLSLFFLIIFTAEFTRQHHYSSLSTDASIYALFHAGFYFSSFIIPRIILLRVEDLKEAVNKLQEVDELLCPDWRSPSWMVILVLLLILQFVSLSNEIVYSFCIHGGSEGPTNSLIFSLGSGEAVVEYITFSFWVLLVNIAHWIVPLQLFIFYRTLANHFLALAAGIRKELIIFDHSRISINSAESNRIKVLYDASVSLLKASEAANSYFGPALLLFITTRLLNTVSTLLHFYGTAISVAWGNSTQVTLFVTGLVFLFRHIFETLFVVWVADLLALAVNTCKKDIMAISLPGCSCENEAAKRSSGKTCSKLQWFRQHILSLNVQVSAWGVFSISREIIPPVAGTITTYFLIAMQFSKDEHDKNNFTFSSTKTCNCTI